MYATLCSCVLSEGGSSIANALIDSRVTPLVMSLHCEERSNE